MDNSEKARRKLGRMFGGGGDLSMKSNIEGGFSLTQYRRYLDEQSGIPGLPGIKVVEQTAAFKKDLRRARREFPGAGTILVPRSTFDGTVELVPMIRISGGNAHE